MGFPNGARSPHGCIHRSSVVSDPGGQTPRLPGSDDFEHGAGARGGHGSGCRFEIHTSRFWRGPGLHRGSGGAGGDDRPVRGALRRRAGASGLAAREIRTGARGMGPVGGGVSGGTADFLRGRIHHTGAAGVEPGAGIETLAALLRDAGNGGADGDARAGAPASGARGGGPTAGRGPGTDHSLRRGGFAAHGDSGRDLLWRMDREAHVHSRARDGSRGRARPAGSRAASRLSGPDSGAAGAADFCRDESPRHSTLRESRWPGSSAILLRRC